MAASSALLLLLLFGLDLGAGGGLGLGAATACLGFLAAGWVDGAGGGRFLDTVGGGKSGFFLLSAALLEEAV